MSLAPLKRSYYSSMYYLVLCSIFVAVLIVLFYAAIGGNKDLDEHHAEDAYLPDQLQAIADSSDFIFYSAALYAFVNAFPRINNAIELVDRLMGHRCRVALGIQDLQSVDELIAAQHIVLPCDQQRAQARASLISPYVAAGIRWITKISTVFMGIIACFYSWEKLAKLSFGYRLGGAIAIVNGFITTAFRFIRADVGAAVTINIINEASLISLFCIFLPLFVFKLALSYPFPLYYQRVYAELGLPVLLHDGLGWNANTRDMKNFYGDFSLVCTYMAAVFASVPGYLQLMTRPVAYFKKIKNDLKNPWIFYPGLILAVLDAACSGIWALVLLLKVIPDMRVSLPWSIAYDIFLYFSFYGLASSLPAMDKTVEKVKHLFASCKRSDNTAEAKPFLAQPKKSVCSCFFPAKKRKARVPNYIQGSVNGDYEVVINMSYGSRNT